MARSSVPKFGNWENEETVPYTIYFDKARKNRGGKMINPNDPQEYPDMFPNIDPSPLAAAPIPSSKPKPRPEPIGRRAVGPTPDHRASREDGDFKQFMNSPAPGENTGQRNGNESNYGGRGQRPVRSTRPSVGSEQSFDRSPLHPAYQGKVMGRGVGSEGRSYDSSHGTPSRPRLRASTRGDESPDKGAAVPRFGEWNENDPQSAENFTHIFNKVREERNNGTGNVSGTPKHPSYGARGQLSNEPKKCCFPWW